MFNGRDLAGWIKEGAAGFRARDGVLVCDGSGDYPSWLRSERTYENFVLRFEYRLGLYGESGVFLHAPLHGRNSNVGFEIQLSDDSRDPGPVEHSTGAVFAAVAPRERAPTPLDQWHKVEILFDWPTLRVTINGVVVQDLDVEANPELAHRLRSGYLGLQDRGKHVEFRNLQIRPLPAKEKWLALFNGQNLDGWRIEPPDGARWRVEDGAIVAEDGDGYLITEREFQDFELRAYVKSSPRANGGIFFRWKSLVPKDRGYEVQIEDIPDSNNPTGSIYDVSRAETSPGDPGQWYLMQIRAVGREAQVRVNGATVAHAENLTIVRPGPIALQMHSRRKWIRFKDLKIKDLSLVQGQR